MARTSIDGGVAGATYKVTGTDVAVAPIAAEVLSVDGRLLKSILIENDQVTGYGLRYAFGGTSPSQTANVGMHFLAAGSFVSIEGYANCASLKIINSTNAEAAILWITPYY